jgi:hypothetical protein
MTVFCSMLAGFCFPLPACWLYPLKPGGERKSADVGQKMFMLIYPGPIFRFGHNISDAHKKFYESDSAVMEQCSSSNLFKES